MTLLAPVATLGRNTMELLAAIGRIAIFFAQTIGHMLRPPFYFKEFGHALLTIGYFSLPVVGLTPKSDDRRGGKDV